MSLPRYAVVHGRRAYARGDSGLFAPYTTVTFSGESIETDENMVIGIRFDKRPSHWSFNKHKRQKLSTTVAVVSAAVSAEGPAAPPSPSATTEVSATKLAAKEARARAISKRNGPHGRRIARKPKTSRINCAQTTNR